MTLAEKGGISFPVPCPGSEKGAVTARNAEELKRIFFGDPPEVRTLIETKRMLFPPVEEGSVIGRAVFSDAYGNTLGEVPLFASESVPAPAPSPGFFEKLFGAA